MFDTQRVPVKVYRWDDEGAPQVESAAGSIKTILKACLVTGYGEGNKRKDGLGWEMAFEKAQEACFRSTHPKATKWWLGVDDAKYLAGGDRYSRYTDVCGILEPTSATAGKAVQSVWNSNSRIRFSYHYYSEDNVKLKWVLIGHARAFALVLLSPGNLAASPVLYFGEFPSLAVADEHQNLLGVGATDKTPIAVLQELAQAAGGFVESDRARPVVRFKPKWKKASWEVSDAPADVSVPVSVIFSISGQRNVSERANGVYVWPSHNKGKGADVYRNGSNREPRASALTNTLYTDQPVLLAAGIAALSETGVHKRETVSLPVSDKYGIPMANLGEIWQINEPSGNWQGVVVGVSVEVKIENDTPVVTQNVTIDRYFDE